MEDAEDRPRLSVDLVREFLVPRLGSDPVYFVVLDCMRLDQWRVISPLLGGIVIAVIANRLFARRETVIHPFAEPSALVVEGPFRYTRNPMYLGFILALVGFALLLGTLTPWLVIVPFGLILDRKFVRHEQRTMEERFGDDYRAYRQRVRRWI